MEKEQLGTRVEAPLGQRLRVYAAVHRRTVAEVVSAALDSYLPPLADLVRSVGSEPGDAGGAGGLDAVLSARGQVTS
jgi:hypothetical protein